MNPLRVGAEPRAVFPTSRETAQEASPEHPRRRGPLRLLVLALRSLFSFGS